MSQNQSSSLFLKPQIIINRNINNIPLDNTINSGKKTQNNSYLDKYMRKAYLQTISFQPFLPSAGLSFLEGMEFHILVSGIFLQKPQAGYGAETNG